MKIFKPVVFFSFFICLFFSWSALAEVEWKVLNTLNVEKRPQDMAISTSGEFVFILTEDGVVHVYDSGGVLQGKMAVGKHVDSIAAGPKENILIIKSRKKKTVQSILVEFIYDINVKGSPFKGNADAPVIITVFTDYQ